MEMRHPLLSLLFELGLLITGRSLVEPLLAYKSGRLIVTIQAVGKDALTAITPASCCVPFAVVIANELRVPKELQLSITRPLPLLLFVHASENHRFKSKFGHEARIDCRVAESIELPADPRFHLELLPEPVVCHLEIA